MGHKIVLVKRYAYINLRDQRELIQAGAIRYGALPSIPTADLTRRYGARVSPFSYCRENIFMYSV